MTFTKSRKFLMVLTAFFALGAFQVPASATFINGGIGFGGLFTPSGGTGVDLSDATGIDIFFSQVTTASGDLAGTVGMTATFNHLDFNPDNTPVTPLWSVGGGAYSFDLLAINLDFQDADEINLSGSGLMMANGFDDTPGTWTFSGQQGNVFFTFSSIAIAENVAEPSTLLLLGIGFIGLALMRKRVR